MERPQLPPTDGNPILALVTAVIFALLYVLQGIRWLVTFVTLTVPGWIVRALQYSFTISLGFYSLLALFVAGVIASSFLVRYKYLNTYAELKDNPLPPPSPTSLPHLPDAILQESLTSSRSSNPFHNYLDDFLSAIRIFGFLEKPVFHELSRHLQTRRLGAGETLEVGGGEFWCVVEGRVQVFAPSSDTASAANDATSYNGYHLLNEVSTGGTLSSLFSILSLFTEEIQLQWDTPAQRSPTDTEDDGDDTDTDTDLPEVGRPATKTRTNSDVSHLDFGLPADMPASVSPRSYSQELPPNPRKGSAQDSLVSDATVVPSADATGSETPDQRSPSPPPPAVQLQDFLATSSLPPTVLSSPALRAVNEAQDTAHSSPAQKPSHRRKARSTKSSAPSPVSAFEGTIARATVDTTLAVIPAEAFKKLTRKFPKASGSIVQVVLERFSRVTFMTAHKYLGLTKEVLKSESALNHLVSHPLPRSFYTSGGMQALRERFQPEVRAGKATPGNNRRGSREEAKDYFNFAPSTPGTTKAPSLPSVTPRQGNTPLSHPQHKVSSISSALAPSALSITKINGSANEQKKTPAAAAPAVTPGSAFTRRTSAMRKQVGAGDLAMSSFGVDEGPYYKPKAQTPSLARMDTWRGRVNSGAKKDILRQPELGEDEEGEAFDLREAVMLCIAKSIGLVQPPQSARNASAAASASNFSTPNSPMFPPASTRSGRQAPFGNVLDMMNASRSSEGVIGGMLRESLFPGGQSGAGEDESSMHESSMGGIPNPRAVLAEMQGKVEILYFAKGKPLVKEGEKAAGLYYVIDGFLDVSISSHPSQSVTPQSSTEPISRASDSPKTPFGSALGLDSQDDSLLLPPSHPSAAPDETLFTVKPGGIAGYLSSLCSTDSYVNITAKTDCFVGFLPHSALESILERKPIVLLTLAKRLLSLLSPLILHIDAALDWQQLDAGKVLFRKGDRSRDFYIVINGRLRSLDEKESSVEIVREYGQGDSIGELDVITADPRPDTLHAIRDSELVRIPGALFDAISIKHPVTTIQFLRLIASRVRKAVDDKPPLPSTTVVGGSNISRSNLNLKTVCILGSTRHVPVAAFATKLKASLEELGASTSYLDQSSVMRQLGRHAFSRIGKLKVAGWLADQEQRYRTVLYVADTPVSSQWTLTSIRQADLVLIVAMGDDPSLGEYEKLLLATKTTARKELVLLHDDRHVAPGSTRQWLRNRPWCHAHHHVELPGVVIPTKAVPIVHDPAAVAAFKHLREKVEGRIKKYRGLRPLGRPRRPPHMNDFARIARRLCGKSIGIVLGGGGARGISHIGMLQALEELGIPVDSIGGCSIGAFVGGLYARTTDLLETTGRTKQFSGRMGSLWRLLSDVTYPFVAYTTGHEFNRGIYKAFYDTHIEDFWIPFFANSTNITHSRMEIHRTGYAWRYVRASMTLAGLLPPLSDSGNLLVDGGYMDNIPAGALKSLGVQNIIAVDVGSLDDTSPRKYGDSVSGWWIFLNRFNPFMEIRVPSMTEVSSRLTYVSSARSLEEVKNTPGCLYMSMPVQQFETLGGFNQFSEVLAVGLDAARKQLAEWKEQGKLPTGLVDEVKGAKAIQRGNRLRRMSI